MVIGVLWVARCMVATQAVVQPTQDRMENEAMQNTDMDQGRVGSVFKAMARKETTISIFRFAESAKS